MTDVEEICYQGHMIEKEEGILHLDADPEVTIIQEDHTEDKITKMIDGHNRQQRYKINPDHQLGYLEFHEGLPPEKKINVSVANSFVILPIYCPEKDTSASKGQHGDTKIPKSKGCSHLYEGDPEEEEVMAAMCHNAETYSSMHVNREDDKYFKQLNQ